jgi:hypothetical protein
VLMILGALVNRMPLALWILAIGPNIAVIHRIVQTWRQTEGIARLRTRDYSAAQARIAREASDRPRVLTRSAGRGG